MRVSFGFVVVLMVLVGCTDRTQAPITPAALDVGTATTVYGATSRAPNQNNRFGSARSPQVSLVEMTVSIPPSHTPGSLVFGYGNPDPETEFTLAAERTYDSAAAFRADLRASVSGLTGREREVTIFVHGFNSTHTEGAFRTAQLSRDIGLSGATLYYSWPSQGKPLAYAYDGDSALFARDGLEYLIRQVLAADVGKVVLVAHSMGSMVVMETLRQMEIQDPGSPRRNINGVVLISPDLDIEVFRNQMQRIKSPPDPFLVFVSEKDSILNLSRRLRGNHSSERLGNLQNIAKVSDLPISVIDTTEFSSDAGSSHFVPATSPALIAMMKSAEDLANAMGRDGGSFEDLLPGQVTHTQGATEIRVWNNEDR